MPNDIQKQYYCWANELWLSSSLPILVLFSLFSFSWAELRPLSSSCLKRWCVLPSRSLRTFALPDNQPLWQIHVTTLTNTYNCFDKYMAWIWPIHVWSLRTFTPPVNQPLWLKHVKTLTKIYITSLTNTFTWQSTTDQFRQHYYQHLCIILIIFWQCWSTTPPDSWSRLSRWSWPWWRTRPTRARCASCASSSRSSSRCSCTWRRVNDVLYLVL